MLPQWGIFAIFAASLLAGLVFLIVTTVKVTGSIAAGSREEAG